MYYAEQRPLILDRKRKDENYRANYHVTAGQPVMARHASELGFARDRALPAGAHETLEYVYVNGKKAYTKSTEEVRVLRSPVQDPQHSLYEGAVEDAGVQSSTPVQQLVKAAAGIAAAASMAVLVGCAAAGTGGQREARASPGPAAAQALRTCVDRWNAGNMIGWGPALVHVSVRRLDAAQLAAVGVRDPGLRHCVVSVAREFRREPGGDCGGSVVPGKPHWCFNEETYNCVINQFGAYGCPTNADTAHTLLTNKNATTDERGILKLDAPLEGTHATPPLAWQRLYPHTDGWIEPWTRSGALRAGLRFTPNPATGNYRGGGSCFRESYQTRAKSALRCVWQGHIVEPCFPKRSNWNRPGALVACSDWAGATTFSRFVIAERS